MHVDLASAYGDPMTPAPASATEMVDHEAAKRIAGIILAAVKAVQSVADPSGVQNLARAYLDLRAQLADRGAELSIVWTSNSGLTTEVLELRDRAIASDASLAAMREYVQHKPQCSRDDILAKRYGFDNCTCGLSALLSAGPGEDK